MRLAYRIRNRSRRGQALVMVTLSLLVMAGMLGLAVDLGWSFYRAKTAQAAADAAALAAVKNVYSALGQTGTYNCGNAAISCQPTPLPCSSISAGNLLSGCQYSQQNQFMDGGDGGRQTVTMQADATTPFVTATGPVEVVYWVTARTRENIPQLFSSVFGNTVGNSGAKATAAVADSIVDGALILMNRQWDRAVFGNSDAYGVNLKVQANDNQGMYALQTAGNIVLHSECAGSSLGAGHCRDGNQSAYAGQNQGGGTVYTLPAGTKIKGAGWYSLGGSAQWLSTPTNGATGAFGDPMAGKGQPPPPGSLPDYEYMGGVINGSNDPNNPLVLPPGNYYAVTNQNCGTGCTQVVATGDPISIQGYVRFSDGGTGFGETVIYGGLRKNGGGTAGVTFDPGMYVLAGAKPANQNSPGTVLDVSNNFFLKDGTSSTGQNADAGEIFVLTDPDYVGGNGQTLTVPTKVQAYQQSAGANRLQFGKTSIQTGNNVPAGQYNINLHGLNKTNGLISGTPLETFAPTLFWQDQRNSHVNHDPGTGIVNSSCGSVDQPCTNTLPYPSSPELILQASPGINLYGVVYQSRGAWTNLIGGGGYTGPLQLISGALWVQGNANVNLTAPSMPLTIRMVSLIE